MRIVDCVCLLVSTWVWCILFTVLLFGVVLGLVLCLILRSGFVALFWYVVIVLILRCFQGCRLVVTLWLFVLE